MTIEGAGRTAAKHEWCEDRRLEPTVLSEAGYQYTDYKAHVMHLFCKPSAAVRTHHLHLVPYQSELWHARLAFRDVLRVDAVVAAEYAALKLALANQFEFDREAHTEGKSQFMARALAGA